MHTVRKLLHRRHLVEGVAAIGAENLQVPGQGGRVAGDVDDAGRGGGEDGREQGSVAALPRRVHDDDVWPGKADVFLSCCLAVW